MINHVRPKSKRNLHQQFAAVILMHPLQLNNKSRFISLMESPVSFPGSTLNSLEQAICGCWLFPLDLLQRDCSFLYIDIDLPNGTARSPRSSRLGCRGTSRVSSLLSQLCIVTTFNGSKMADARGLTSSNTSRVESSIIPTLILEWSDLDIAVRSQNRRTAVGGTPRRHIPERVGMRGSLMKVDDTFFDEARSFSSSQIKLTWRGHCISSLSWIARSPSGKEYAAIALRLVCKWTVEGHHGYNCDRWLWNEENSVSYISR